MKPATQQHPVSTFGDVGTPSAFDPSKVLNEVQGSLWNLEAWFTAAHAMLAHETPHREEPDVALAAQVCARAQRITRETIHLAERSANEVAPIPEIDGWHDVCTMLDNAEALRVSLPFIDTCLESSDAATQCDVIAFAHRPLSEAQTLLEKIRELIGALFEHIQRNIAEAQKVHA